MPPSFFLCYRRQDAGYAAALSQALIERHGRDRVFKDITSLELARDWRREVTAAIGRSTHVLALVGPTWMAGVDQQGLRDGHHDPIVFELVEAAKTGRAVVPVLLASQRMPPAHRLPAPLQWLSSLHAAHVRVESADADIAALVNGLPQPPRRPVDAPPQRPDPAPGPKRRSGAGLLVTLAVLVTAVIVALTSGAVDAAVHDLKGVGLGTDPKLTISPTSGPGGTKITATATGFVPGKTVRFGVANLASDVEADSAGRAIASLEIPDYGLAGPVTYTVSARQDYTLDLNAEALFQMRS